MVLQRLLFIIYYCIILCIPYEQFCYIYDFRLGETCSHVAAMLYNIEAAVRLGYTKDDTCTDVACRWNACYIDNVQPAPLSSILLYSTDAKSNLRPVRPDPNMSEATVQEQQSFLSGLSKAGPNAIALCAFNEHNHGFRFQETKPRSTLPRPLREWYRPDVMGDQREEYVMDALKGMMLTDEQIVVVEEMTRTQHSTVAWHQQRAGRITASFVHDVLATDIINPSRSLIKRICSSNNIELNVPALQWGRNYEKSALYVYAQCRGLENDRSENVLLPNKI